MDRNDLARTRGREGSGALLPFSTREVGMPKKRDETLHEFRARMAGLLCEVIEEAEEKGEPDIAELLRLALIEVVRSPPLVH